MCHRARVIGISSVSFAATAAIALSFGAREARAQEIAPRPATPYPSVVAVVEPEAPAWPRVGGHVGLAVPVATITGGASKTTTYIGSDFVSLGLAPGVTVKVSPHWAVDFEMVVYDTVDKANQRTKLVVDPGIIYSGRGGVSAGLRGAISVREKTNFGVIPLLNVSLGSSGPVKPFIELDLPIFLQEKQEGASRRFEPAFTVQPHIGFAF